MTTPLRIHADRAAFVTDPQVELTNQVCDALDLVDRDAADFLAWPFPGLEALAGGMAPGDVWFVCAFSGNGKTTFLSSVLDRWYEAGKKVYVLPLETRPKVFRTFWACQRLGIHPGDVLSGHLSKLPNGEALRSALKEELHRQVEGPMRDRVRVKGVPAINTARLSYAVQEASEWGADVVIVDHIDHVAGGDGTNLHAESVKVNGAALDLAQDHGIILLCASQLNNGSMAGARDRLAQYGPPQPNHVFMGSHKRMISTGMIGLHRKLRDRRDGESTKEYKASIAAARSGEDPMSALEPGVMAVTAMKLRNYGARENQRCLLGVERGQVVEIPERDRYSTAPGSRGRP
jgi:hypothetical protein